MEVEGGGEKRVWARDGQIEAEDDVWRMTMRNGAIRGFPGKWKRFPQEPRLVSNQSIAVVAASSSRSGR